MAGTVFIFGLGYVGRPLGHLLASRGWQIRGTTRTPERLATDAAAGWQVYRFADDVPLTDPEEALDGVDAVLSTITAIGGSDPVLDAHGDVLSGFTGWSGYVSATSVYPDRPDGFCYEDTPTDPATKRGKARVIAEARWQELLGTELFRAAGIYGPGRSPFDSLRDGTARIIEHRGQLFNRIHVDDICRIIIAAMNRPRRGRIVNLADEKPAAQGDVVRHAADWAGRNLGPVDFICCIYATAVFVDGEVLKRGFHEMRAAGTDYAVSVTPYAAPIERALRVTPKGRLAAVNLEAMAKRSQDIEETYHDAAQFYWGSPQAFAATQAERIARAVPVILPRYRVQDIDTEDDWMRAELMYRALFEV